MYLPKVIDDLVAQVGWQLTQGVSRFLQELSDLAADSPRAPEWFYRFVLKPLLDK